MKKSAVVSVLIISAALAAAGCQNSKTRAVEGATIGGLLGAAAGGIIGHQSGHGGEGAAIGAAAGVIGGALVGAQIDKPGANATTVQAVTSGQMTLQQVVDLAKQGVGEDAIIEKIKSTNTKFRLSPEDVQFLKQQGVSIKVINFMQGL